MIKYLFSQKVLESITSAITDSVQKTLSSYHSDNQSAFDEISTKLDTLRLELKSLDERLTRKEIKDKTEYGHVQYKLSSLQSEVIQKKPQKKSSVN